MGTPRYARTILEKILGDDLFDVVALFCQPDKPVGRKQVITPPDTKALLSVVHPKIPIYQPDTLKNEEWLSVLCGLNPDFIVVAAFGQILPKSVLDVAPCINVHASILPNYRGASPVHESILNMESHAGVSTMKMNEGLDTGDMLAFSFVRLRGDENIEQLTQKLAELGGELTLKTLKNFDNISPLPQDDALATLCKKIKKSDGVVRFNDAKSLYARFRAFVSWPEIQLQSGLKLKKMELEKADGEYREGEILEISKDSVRVGCGSGSIRLFSVQPPSKNEMDASSYLRGKRLDIGDTLV